MRTRSAFMLGILLLFGTAALAQDYAKVEVPLGYSYMRFNPENSNIVSGLSLNGGGGGVTVFVNHAFGITAEFNGYGNLSRTLTFPATANSPFPAGGTVKEGGKLFTHDVGPVLEYR